MRELSEITLVRSISMPSSCLSHWCLRPNLSSEKPAPGMYRMVFHPYSYHKRTYPHQAAKFLNVAQMEHILRKDVYFGMDRNASCEHTAVPSGITRQPNRFNGQIIPTRRWVQWPFRQSNEKGGTAKQYYFYPLPWTFSAVVRHLLQQLAKTAKGKPHVLSDVQMVLLQKAFRQFKSDSKSNQFKHQTNQIVNKTTGASRFLRR